METKTNTNNFSVGLGLFDYINPIFYSITSITIYKSLKQLMSTSLLNMYSLGMVISIIFGFAILTVKFIVGLGIMKFKMPVNLVLCVNTGIFLTGFALFSYVFKVKTLIIVVTMLLVVLLLGYLVYKTKKLNTSAVLIGAVGYMLIYFSLMNVAKQSGMLLAFVMYLLAICLFIFLCLVGIKSDLKNSRVHWAIEIGNVLCQGLVAISTLMIM